MHNINLTEVPTVSDRNNLESNNLSFQLQERLESLISSFELELTASQQKAITKLWQFIHSSEHFFLLAGYAGTGKSTIVFAVIKELVRLGKRVALTLGC